MGRGWRLIACTREIMRSIKGARSLIQYQRLNRAKSFRPDESYRAGLKYEAKRRKANRLSENARLASRRLAQCRERYVLFDNFKAAPSK